MADLALIFGHVNPSLLALVVVGILLMIVLVVMAWDPESAFGLLAIFIILGLLFGVVLGLVKVFNG